MNVKKKWNCTGREIRGRKLSGGYRGVDSSEVNDKCEWDKDFQVHRKKNQTSLKHLEPT